MTYRADCTISQPKEQGQYQSRKSLGGFGWHPDRGLFIPVEVKEDNIDPPYPTGLNPKSVVDPDRMNIAPVIPSTPIPITQQFISNNSQAIPHE